jgi:PilZ domain
MPNSYVQRRKGEPRATFEPPLDVRVMTIDGTWSGESVLIDIADNGARLKMTGRATALTEFFLILNSFGPPVFRHCKRVWVEGQLIGVSFNKTNIGIKSLEEVRREAELV